tara:strand:+ start:25236 stop:27143 length:1908 start_codon:yes stop_codon:yes gene_type:complete
MNVKDLHTSNNFNSDQRGVKAVLIAIVLCFSSFSRATDYYVNDSSTSGDVFCTSVGNNSNDGLSPSTPKESLTSVLNTYGPSGLGTIVSGDVFYIDAGTYYQTDANIGINLDGISIIGAGRELTTFDNDMASADANRLFTVTADDIVLQDFAITGYNRGTGDAFALQFEGVSNNVVTNVFVFGNDSGGGSSAIVVNGGSQVTFNGGGSSCNPSLSASTVAGGGVNIEGNGNNVTFNGYGFSNNSKDLQGGSGLYVNGDNTTTVDINDCIFSENINSGGTGGAGLFVLNGANVTISGTCFNNNSHSTGFGIDYGGAILVGEGSSVTIDASSFDSNSAVSSGNGGAIAINSTNGSTGGTPSVDLNNCSFSNNSAPDGADIFTRGTFDGDVTAFECTWTSTGGDNLHINDGTITLENSGSPNQIGGVIFTNTNVSTTVPTTACPVMIDACYSSPLPVELLGFNGECEANSNLLTWSTASEENNDYFSLERSYNGYDFRQVGIIPGNGNTQNLTKYSFKDKDVPRGIVYYRLSQFDYDGKSETFDIISVENRCANAEVLRAHYDQLNGKVKVFHNFKDLEIQQLSLLSSTGQRLATGANHMSNHLGYSEIILPASIAKGIYIVELQTINEVNTVKIIIQ